MSSLILPPGYGVSTAVTHNRPQPNPEVESRTRAWLKDYDSLLDIRWFENIHYNKKHENFEGRYALVCKWPIGDVRYAMIQSGEIGNDPYDILGWFTEDMHDGGSVSISPDLFETKVRELLASADNTRTPWKQRLKDVFEKNAAKRRKTKVDFIENQVHDLASYHRNEGLGIHQVNVPKEIH